MKQFEVIAIENETISLKCNASGYPEPSIAWSPDSGEEISIEVETGINAENGLTNVVSTLTLSLVAVENTGNYTCTANNTVFGEDSENFRVLSLTVYCECFSTSFSIDSSAI